MLVIILNNGYVVVIFQQCSCTRYVCRAIACIIPFSVDFGLSCSLLFSSAVELGSNLFTCLPEW